MGFAWLQVFGIEASKREVSLYKLIESFNKFHKELVSPHSFVYGGNFILGACIILRCTHTYDTGGMGLVAMGNAPLYRDFIS